MTRSVQLESLNTAVPYTVPSGRALTVRSILLWPGARAWYRASPLQTDDCKEEGKLERSDGEFRNRKVDDQTPLGRSGEYRETQ